MATTDPTDVFLWLKYSFIFECGCVPVLVHSLLTNLSMKKELWHKSTTFWEYFRTITLNKARMWHLFSQIEPEVNDSFMIDLYLPDNSICRRERYTILYIKMDREPSVKCGMWWQEHNWILQPLPPIICALVSLYHVILGLRFQIKWELKFWQPAPDLMCQN